MMIGCAAKIIFTKPGKYVEIIDEDTYLHILHYGFTGKYLPIGFDVLLHKRHGAF
jgi:hypothetical protein